MKLMPQWQCERVRVIPRTRRRPGTTELQSNDVVELGAVDEGLLQFFFLCFTSDACRRVPATMWLSTALTFRL